MAGKFQAWSPLMKRLFALAAAAAILYAAPAWAALPVGAAAPEFSTHGSLGGQQFDFDLDQALKKGPVVLYFFPAAYTPGCTIEAKEFADAADQFAAAGATLIGVTGGAKLADGTMASAAESAARLAEFTKEHCRDKFPVAAVSSDTIKAYDVSLPAKPDLSDRTSYVIAPDGKIILAYSDFKPDQHVAKTLDAVKTWKAAHP
jgi:peroxiredoxin